MIYKILRTFTWMLTLGAAIGVAFVYAETSTSEVTQFKDSPFCQEMGPILEESRDEGYLSQEEVDYLLRNCYANPEAHPGAEDS